DWARELTDWAPLSRCAEARIRGGPIGPHRPRHAADADPYGGRAGPLALPESSRANADDRLPIESLARVEGGAGIVEGRDDADVGPQPPVPYALDDLAQLGTIGLDDEVDCQAAGGPRLGRPYDGHQGSSGPDQACGPLLDVSADYVEAQVDAADVLQGVVAEVDELLRAEVERLLAVGGAPGADDVGAGLTC